MNDDTMWEEFEGNDSQMRAVCQDIWDEYQSENDQDSEDNLKNQKNNNPSYSIKGNSEIKDISSDKREVAIYLAKFDNIDSDNDVIIKGAFKKSLKERGVNSSGNRKIQFLRHHDWTKQIGSFTKLEEDDYGLFAVAKLGTSTIGEDAWRDYNEGIIREHSIGFRYIPDKMKWIEDKTLPQGGYNMIKEVQLFEGSAVTFGANEMTNVVGIVKGMESKEDILNNYCSELSLIIESITKGKGSEERLYGLEMRAKFLSSQISILAKVQPFDKDTESKSEPLIENEIDWNFIFDNINK
jgi:HK97 family phage prohead protease